MPRKLYEMMLSSGLKATYNTILDMLYRKRIHVSIMRKAHLAILSNTMQQHEIDLLQGRVSSITVKHYTKHLREIAVKYLEAYKKYLYLLEL